MILFIDMALSAIETAKTRLFAQMAVLVTSPGLSMIQRSGGHPKALVDVCPGSELLKVTSMVELAAIS